MVLENLILAKYSVIRQYLANRDIGGSTKHDWPQRIRPTVLRECLAVPNLKRPRRCEWAGGELLVHYHDEEWGIPLHDDTRLFEMISLEGAQAGLSWTTILNKRDAYRKAFHNFDIARVSEFKGTDVRRLVENDGIVRNKMKVLSTVNNASRVLDVQREFGSFSNFVWSFVGGKPIVNNFRKLAEIPASSLVSEMMSRDLKKRGFTFVGPTISYAFMQAVGIVDDHLVDCFRHTSRRD